MVVDGVILVAWSCFLAGFLFSSAVAIVVFLAGLRLIVLDRLRRRIDH